MGRFVRHGGGRDLVEEYERKVNALYGVLADIYGSDRVVLKAGKVGALSGMRSENLGERIVALQRLVYDDPTIDEPPRFSEIPEVLAELEEELADLLARRTVEDEIEQKIQDRMAQKHEEYVADIRAQVMREISPETAETKRKLERLQQIEQRGLARSLAEVLRPKRFEEVIGQDAAVQALLAKLASPYPQHILLYGPPGVGKTTAARLALEAARERQGSPFSKDAPFVEVDGTTLRWDPREVTNPLLGSVHDPIYQGARHDFAEGGVPEPKLGLVTEANGGVLFIDEIGEMDPILQNKLLKVLEDKRVYFESSYYDPDDPHVPEYVHKLFREGAPADFVLIGATTRDPEDITPALRSRCAEIFFAPLTPDDIRKIVRQGAEKLGVPIEPAAVDDIAERTIEARKALNILADAYALAVYEAGGPDKPAAIRAEHVRTALSAARVGREARTLASATPQVGRVIGLAVRGFLGSALEIEAVAYPAREPGKGKIRFNETAGSMARDSVFTAGTVLRRITGKDLADYDVHVNVVGGGHIDGPSAGAAIFTAIYSAVEGRPVRQDVAITGEVSLSGRIQEVGGIPEKLYGARQAGVRRVVLPAANAGDVPDGRFGLELSFVETADEVLRELLSPLG
ncbi:MAG: ATP-dependent protease, Lon family [Firmicutes bacterium]|nr:ATP-dependent protease, Lon family [Bacillota bacterium]